MGRRDRTADRTEHRRAPPVATAREVRAKAIRNGKGGDGVGGKSPGAPGQGGTGAGGSKPRAGRAGVGDNAQPRRDDGVNQRRPGWQRNCTHQQRFKALVASAAGCTPRTSQRTGNRARRRRTRLGYWAAIRRANLKCRHWMRHGPQKAWGRQAVRSGGFPTPARAAGHQSPTAYSLGGGALTTPVRNRLTIRTTTPPRSAVAAGQPRTSSSDCPMMAANLYRLQQRHTCCQQR